MIDQELPLGVGWPMPKPTDAVTQAEHQSLKDSVSSLAESMVVFRDGIAIEMREMREASQRDSRETHANIERLGESLTRSIHELYDRNLEDVEKRSKIPYPMLSLIFSVIIVISAVITWNMTRIEQQSQREMEINRLAHNDIIDNSATMKERTRWMEDIQGRELDKLDDLEVLTQHRLGQDGSDKSTATKTLTLLGSDVSALSNEILRLSAAMSAMKVQADANSKVISQSHQQP